MTYLEAGHVTLGRCRLVCTLAVTTLQCGYPDATLDPTVFGDSGGEWLQSSEGVGNPANKLGYPSQAGGSFYDDR
jgi:hypothetical protein